MKSAFSFSNEKKFSSFFLNKEKKCVHDLLPIRETFNLFEIKTKIINYEEREGQRFRMIKVNSYEPN